MSPEFILRSPFPHSSKQLFQASILGCGQGASRQHKREAVGCWFCPFEQQEPLSEKGNVEV